MSNSLVLSVILKELMFKNPWNSRSQIFQSHLDYLNGFEHTSFNKARLVTPQGLSLLWVWHLLLDSPRGQLGLVSETAFLAVSKWQYQVLFAQLGNPNIHTLPI